MMRLRFAVLTASLLFVLFVCAPVAAHADSVLYTFTGTGSITGTNFTYLSTSGFLTFDTGNLVPTTAGDFILDTGNGAGPSDFGALTTFDFSNQNVVYLTSSSAGSRQISVSPYHLNTYGLQTISPYSALYRGSFNLYIEPASPASTPEPSSFALLGTGLLGVTGVVSRRLTLVRRISRF